MLSDPRKFFQALVNGRNYHTPKSTETDTCSDAKTHKPVESPIHHQNWRDQTQCLWRGSQVPDHILPHAIPQSTAKSNRRVPPGVACPISNCAWRFSWYHQLFDMRSWTMCYISVAQSLPGENGFTTKTFSSGYCEDTQHPVHHEYSSSTSHCYYVCWVTELDSLNRKSKCQESTHLTMESQINTLITKWTRLPGQLPCVHSGLSNILLGVGSLL
jgi:hypothetical protein